MQTYTDFARLMDVNVRFSARPGSGPRCLEQEEDDATREIEIHSYARQLLEAHRAKAIAEAAQNAIYLEGHDTHARATPELELLARLTGQPESGRRHAGSRRSVMAARNAQTDQNLKQLEGQHDLEALFSIPGVKPCFPIVRRPKIL